MGLPGVRYAKRSEALFSGAAPRGAKALPKALPVCKGSSQKRNLGFEEKIWGAMEPKTNLRRD